MADRPAWKQIALDGLEHHADMVSIYDTYANCLYANKAYERYTGWTPEEIIGGRAQDLFPMERHAEIEQLHAEALDVAKQGMRIHMDVHHKDGHTVPVDSMVTLCPGGPSGRGFFFIVARPTE